VERFTTKPGGTRNWELGWRRVDGGGGEPADRNGPKASLTGPGFSLRWGGVGGPLACGG